MIFQNLCIRMIQWTRRFKNQTRRTNITNIAPDKKHYARHLTTQNKLTINQHDSYLLIPMYVSIYLSMYIYIIYICMHQYVYIVYIYICTTTYILYIHIYIYIYICIFILHIKIKTESELYQLWNMFRHFKFVFTHIWAYSYCYVQ